MIQLKRVPFSDALLPEVSNFDCGNELWEIEVASWLKAEPSNPDSASALQKAGRCSVWVYRHPSTDDIVGFTSLGTSRWKWPAPNSKRVMVNIIPHFAVAKDFWGQPDGPRAERFSTQMLIDVVSEARSVQGVLPLLGLFVHEHNGRAIQFYKAHGFEFFDHRFEDDATGAHYPAMIVKL
jgi:GNAT superfamily N-acetyltransferase